MTEISATPPLQTPTRDPKLWQAAQGLEANFLSEMLKSAGLGETPEGFGGGIGEDQFGSFLRQQQAEAMTRAGGIGLSEQLYQAVVKDAAHGE